MNTGSNAVTILGSVVVNTIFPGSVTLKDSIKGKVIINTSEERPEKERIDEWDAEAFHPVML